MVLFVFYLILISCVFKILKLQNEHIPAQFASKYERKSKQYNLFCLSQNIKNSLTDH